MKKIPVKPYTKAKLFTLLNDLPTTVVRAAMHKIQGENRKYKVTLLPNEVEDILKELGCENLIQIV